MNSFGRIYRTTVFGASHDTGVGCVIDGCPPGTRISTDTIQKQLDRRRPGGSDISSSRKERDKLTIISGIVNSLSTGGPLAAMVKNMGQDSTAYEAFKIIPRPGHADYPATVKYGGFNDYRGGGIFSGRMTIPLVISGSIASQVLRAKGISIGAHSLRIGRVWAKSNPPIANIERVARENDAACADPSIAKLMKAEILDAKREKDSVGGIIECIATGLPVGVGEPIFDSTESMLSHLLFSIPGVKGIEFGAGFQVAEMMGSEDNDEFAIRNGSVVTKSNNAGGILGGLSTGMPIILRVAVKPTSSIGKPQKSVNLKKMKEVEIEIAGRHDPCIVPRAVPVVESVVAIGLLDLLLTGGAI